jgi:hypothetical protein
MISPTTPAAYADSAWRNVASLTGCTPATTRKPVNRRYRVTATFSAPRRHHHGGGHGDNGD